MDLEQLKYLTPEQKDTYMRMERLFGSPGWEDVMQWALVNKAAAGKRQMDATSWDQNRVAYGARLAFEMLEQLATGTEAEFEQFAASAQEAAEVDETLENE